MRWSCNTEKYCKTWLSPTHVRVTQERDGHEPNGGGVSDDNKDLCGAGMPCYMGDIAILT